MYRVDLADNFSVHCGDALEVLKSLSDESVHCCITSPPYYGLRDYGTGTWEGGDPNCQHESRPQVAGTSADRNRGTLRDKPSNLCKCGAQRVDRQIGLEETPDEYIDKLVEIFREVRRVLRDDGTLWVNIGDSYAANRTYQVTPTKWKALDFGKSNASKVPPNCKPKDLLGIPWMLAFALRKDGWYLLSEIIFWKPNAMPESVKDRPTKAHEQIFLLSKSEKYFYDTDAISEPLAASNAQRTTKHYNTKCRYGVQNGGNSGLDGLAEKMRSGSHTRKNKRSVWSINTKPFKGAHFAVFPPELPETCLLAGSAKNGVVLDPFSGSGTTGTVAVKHGRSYIGIELNPDYVEITKKRYEKEIGIANSTEKEPDLLAGLFEGIANPSA